MFKKITGSILTIMLMAGMFLGAAGVVIPEPVHAEYEYPGPYELRVKLDRVINEHGQDATSDVSSIIVTVGDRTVESNTNEHDLTISRLTEVPNSYDLKITTGEGHSVFGPVNYTVSGASGSGTKTTAEPHPKTCTCSYTLTHYHENDHSWEYSAEDNVITATCTNTETACPLKAPTLTLNAEGKYYDGKPVTATLTPNETWTAANGLPEIDKSAITYIPGNLKNAGTYIARYTEGGVTADKAFTIDRKGVLVGGVKVENKEYDGTRKAILDTSKAGIIGVLEGDEVGLSVTGEYEDPEEGPDKTVKMYYTLTGADADNYYIIDSPLAPKTVKASIYVKGNGGPDDYDEGSGKKGSSSKSSPDTGDHNDITGLLAIMLLSAGALGAMGFRRIRENRK